MLYFFLVAAAPGFAPDFLSLAVRTGTLSLRYLPPSFTASLRDFSTRLEACARAPQGWYKPLGAASGGRYTSRWVSELKRDFVIPPSPLFLLGLESRIVFALVVLVLVFGVNAERISTACLPYLERHEIECIGRIVVPAIPMITAKAIRFHDAVLLYQDERPAAVVVDPFGH